MDDHERHNAKLWDDLPGNARDVLAALCHRGPTYDGDIPSKAGRDVLLARGMVVKIAIKDNQQGYQAATYLGSAVYRCGVVERRQDVVRKLVGSNNVKTNRRV